VRESLAEANSGEYRWHEQQRMNNGFAPCPWVELIIGRIHHAFSTVEDPFADSANLAPENNPNSANGNEDREKQLKHHSPALGSI